MLRLSNGAVATSIAVVEEESGPQALNARKIMVVAV